MSDWSMESIQKEIDRVVNEQKVRYDKATRRVLEMEGWLFEPRGGEDWVRHQDHLHAANVEADRAADVYLHALRMLWGHPGMWPNL